MLVSQTWQSSGEPNGMLPGYPDQVWIPKPQNIQSGCKVATLPRPEFPGELAKCLEPYVARCRARFVCVVSADEYDFLSRQFGDQLRTIRDRYPPFVVVEGVEKVTHECCYGRLVANCGFV
jgi:hypothetical protein